MVSYLDLSSRTNSFFIFQTSRSVNAYCGRAASVPMYPDFRSMLSSLAPHPMAPLALRTGARGVFRSAIYTGFFGYLFVLFICEFIFLTFSTPENSLVEGFKFGRLSDLWYVSRRYKKKTYIYNNRLTDFQPRGHLSRDLLALAIY